MISLHNKTTYSIMESINNINDLVEKASSLGYTSLVITDTCSMFGACEFYKVAKRYNIKPLIGMELIIDDNKFILIAKNNNGYKNIIKLATIISERKIDINDLTKYKEDVILIMPYKYFDNNIYNIYEDKFVGYDNLKDRDNIKESKVFINDVCYLNKEDDIYLDYLYMIRDNKVTLEYEFGKNKGKYLYDKEQLFNMLTSDVIDNMEYIETGCNVTLEYTKGLLPVYDENIDSNKYLEKLSLKGLNKRLNNNISKIYEDRLKYELDVICNLGFSDYILVVYDYVLYAKKNNILVGPGRGSSCGCLVCYTLGITDIDPIKYDLLFERFLNPNRVTMPDIDIDFDATRRNEVIEYVTSKYGKNKVAGIITFNTFGCKQVIRDVARVMDINPVLINELCKYTTNSLKESYNYNERFKKMVDSSIELKKMLKVASHLEGLNKHISVHAAGVVMSKEDITNIIPLYLSNNGYFLCAYSKDYLEELGLLKMDFLSLSNLTFISELINEIRDKEGLNITFDNIPGDNAKALNIFYNVDTDGVFQFESSGMKKFLTKFKIKTFNDIVLALALYRPGPMDSIDTFIDRKEGRGKIDYITRQLEEILKPTFGVIVYQEQIMQIVSKMAGYSFARADILRRAMSKKKESILLEEKPIFIEGCINNGYSKDISEKVYNLILKFANYGFNKSHSVAYAMIAYRIAFLKAHFYKYFIVYNLSSVINSEVKTNIYLCEARSKNLNIISPDINISTDKYILDNNNIYVPISIIKQVGISITYEILLERDKGNFKSFIDFVKRMYNKSINKAVITNLIYAGCFKDYNISTLINNLNKVLKYAELSKDEGLVKVLEPEITIYEEFNKDILMAKEKEIYGFYLSNHPVSKYKKANDINTSDISGLFNKKINIILEIEYINEVVTKNNEIMVFINGIDEVGKCSLTLFPKTYSKYKDITRGDIIRVYGMVERRLDKYQVIVNTLEKLNK